MRIIEWLKRRFAPKYPKVRIAGTVLHLDMSGDFRLPEGESYMLISFRTEGENIFLERAVGGTRKLMLYELARLTQPEHKPEGMPKGVPI
jgi:hypothetical protein